MFLSIKRSFSLLLTFSIFVACHEAIPTDKNKKLLQRNAAKVLPDGRLNVAFLIMDGVYNTELTAPFDVFHHSIFRENIQPMNVLQWQNKVSYSIF